MNLSMYQASVPVFQKMLTNLKALLQKGEAYAAAKQLDPSTLLNARLHPDMFPLTRQVQIAADVAKRGCARLSGIEAPAYEDNETTFAQLTERIDKTLTYLATLKPTDLDGREDLDISVPAGPRTFQFKGLVFLLNWALPNFYFHVTTAYALLRHSGVDVGKMDYLGAV